MNHSVKRSTVATVVALSTAMLLTACSSDQRYKRQVSGDESYLQASELHDLQAPAGMILPVAHGDYDVPHTAASGNVGKQLDIRPPAQPLALVNGARAVHRQHRRADAGKQPRRGLVAGDQSR